jgi:CTP:molybdopterin cytidylyltransferase MocA
MGSVAGVLLAAGAGSRYGEPKAFVSLGGLTLLEIGVSALRLAGCNPVIAVLGAGSGDGRQVTGAEVVVNHEWPSGMGSSLRAGLIAAGRTPADAAVVTLVDQPGITPAAIKRIIRYADPAALVAASYHGVRGHPVLLGRDHWPGVAALAVGDTGAREYLSAHDAILTLVSCEDVADPADLDYRPA